MKVLAIVLSASIFTGCASITGDSTHPVKIETKTQAGEVITGAECKVSNDYGSNTMRSGDTIQVRKSPNDINILCKHPGNPDANARAISRAGKAMYGNIIFGGGIGAIIDHNKGTAYTYPTWMQLVFGKTLVFDRSAEKEGSPAFGIEPTASN